MRDCAVIYAVKNGYVLFVKHEICFSVYEIWTSHLNAKHGLVSFHLHTSAILWNAIFVLFLRFHLNASPRLSLLSDHRCTLLRHTRIRRLLWGGGLYNPEFWNQLLNYLHDMLHFTHLQLTYICHRVLASVCDHVSANSFTISCGCNCSRHVPNTISPET